MSTFGLLKLLQDPTLYQVGTGDPSGIKTSPINFTSKELDYPGSIGGVSQSPLLGRKVTFNITDENANPTFEYSKNNESPQIEEFRGGFKTALDHRKVDFDRIQAFLKSDNGKRFIAKQIALQSQNPRPQKIYNAGINTLASVFGAGISNVRRGGLLPTFGSKTFDKRDYLGEIGGEDQSLLRENNYGLGDPGKRKTENKLIDISNPFKSKKIEYDQFDFTRGGHDKVNLLPILKQKGAVVPGFLGTVAKDFVPFKIKVLDNLYASNNAGGGINRSFNIITFRAFLDSISDDFSATHNTYKYNGRGEEFYTYNKFNRKIQVGFKIAAQSRVEMKPLYQKLNYLAAQTAPQYSNVGRIITPYQTLTIGNWFNDLTGVITSVGIAWQTNYPWEIALDRKPNPETGEIDGKDKDMLIVPHVLDVSLSFQPIHRFTPNNSPYAPFLGIDGDTNSISWTDDPISNIDTVYDDNGNPLKSSYTQNLIRNSQEDQASLTIGVGEIPPVPQNEGASTQSPTIDDIALNTTDSNLFNSLS